jgi:hypothetical protein
MHIGSTLGGAHVEELFVWPPYRQHGLGTALAGHALLYVARMSALQDGELPHDFTVTWHEHEAEAIVRQHSMRSPFVPSWLKNLPWRGSPGVALILRGRYLKLLRQIAQMRVPDGIRVMSLKSESAAFDVIVHHEQRPDFGIVIRSLPHLTRGRME